jgi:transposase
MHRLPNVTGPYQVLLDPDELAAKLGKHRNTIDNWDRRRVIKGLRNMPRTSGRGRRFLQYDLWQVLEALRKMGE